MLDKIIEIYEDSEFQLTLSHESDSTSKAVFTVPGFEDEVTVVWGQGDTAITLKLADSEVPEVQIFTSQEEAIIRLGEIILC